MRHDMAHEPGELSGPDGGTLEIRLLGPFAVLRGAHRLPEVRIGSRKARTLLKRLLIEDSRVVSVDALVEVLWPDRPPDQPERHLAILVSRLRGTLGPAVIAREGEGYRFGAGPSYLVDLAEAGRLANEAEARQAEGEPTLAASPAEQARRLLTRGELLADEPYAQWVDPARAAAAALLRRVRRTAWAAALEMGDLDRAVRQAASALDVEPFDEEACRALMHAYQAQGSPGLALAAYERLRAALAEELGIDPSEQTRSLHRVILRAEHPDGRRPGEAARIEWPPDLTGGEASLVGREPEVAVLRQAWERARAGEAGLVLLVGEAGLGKTRLAVEVVRLAHDSGGGVARARCYETERSLFLQPLADALRPVVTAAGPELLPQLGELTTGLAEVIAEVRGVVPVPPPRPASPELERRRVFEAVAGFIRAVAERRPLLLLLDDLHLAGAATLEFLHFLTRRLAGGRLLVVATARVEEGAEVIDTLGAVAHRCEIGPLPEDAVRELARRSGLAGVAGQIMDRTRGHSLFVVETLRAMVEQPSASPAVAIPDSLRAAVLSRVRRAGSHVADLLQAAATLGGSFDPGLVAALSGQPAEEAARWSAAAARARLLTESGSGYEFANDLIQEIIYQATPLPIRVARHRRAAGLLAEHPAAVAVHASRAGDWGAAAAAYLRAAGAAFHRHALRDAARLLEEALEAARRADDGDAVARVRLLRGRVREALADYHAAYEDHRAVAELARSLRRPDLELAALRQLGGDLLVGMGRPVRECVPYLESALALAEAGADVMGQVDILGRLAVIWTNRLRFERARLLADRAAALARADVGQDDTVRALALDAVKNTLAYHGEVARLDELLPQLAACLPASDFLAIRAWASFEEALPDLARARWSRAAAQVRRAVTLTRETGFVAYESPFLAHLAWVERARGRYGESLRVARRAVRLADATGHPWWMALAGTMLGWTLTEAGALDEGADRLEETLRVAERDGTEGYLMRCLGHLAWVRIVRGEPEAAAALAARVEQMVNEATGWPGLHVAHAALAAATARVESDEPAAAERLVTPVLEAARSAGWVELVVWGDLLLARCRAADGDRAVAEGLASTALAAAERHDLPGLAWQTHGLLAGLLATGEAQAHRASATAILDRLADSLDGPEPRRSFRHGGGARLRSLVQSVGRRGPRMSSASTME